MNEDMGITKNWLGQGAADFVTIGNFIVVDTKNSLKYLYSKQIEVGMIKSNRHL